MLRIKVRRKKRPLTSNLDSKIVFLRTRSIWLGRLGARMSGSLTMAWKRSIMELRRRASASIGGVEGVEAGEEADEDGGDDGVEAAEEVESMVDDKEVLL